MARFGGRLTSTALVGTSPAIREVVELVDMVAQSDCCVVIEGESGTGKELVARRIHARSPRRDAPFIPVNCAGISETLFESQFFGHVRGAFTGAEQTMIGLVRSAEGGTLFMDEVADIPLDIQPKLLRVLQEGEVLAVGSASPVPVNTRFISATNRSLRHEVREKRFREDLFYRLNVVRICVPPLRERPEDISMLLDCFLSKCAARFGRAPIDVGSEVRRELERYPWPGNVRELINWVERLYATGLSPKLLAASLLAEADEMSGDDLPEGMSLEQVERWAIRRAMYSAKGSVQRASQLLRVHRSTLSRKLKEYSIA